MQKARDEMGADGDGPPLRTVSVLCVDDSPYVLEALHVLIEGHKPFAGAIALKWLGGLPRADDLVAECKRTCPDVVLLDIEMPGLSAYEAAERVSEECPDSRIIMFSSSSTPDNLNRAREAGAWGFVSKYERWSNLLDAIRAVAAGEPYFK
jgi:DNA-binding NarL/FixJ family response regulator